MQFAAIGLQSLGPGSRGGARPPRSPGQNFICRPNPNTGQYFRYFLLLASAWIWVFSAVTCVWNAVTTAAGAEAVVVPV